MRLFVAVEIPAAIRSRIVGRFHGNRDRWPAARWVPPENLHLTLLFLGEVERERLAALDRALGTSLWSHPACELSLNGGGTFPEGRPARVAWVGIDGADGLAEAQRKASDACAQALEQAADSGPFHPHVTVARPRRPWPRAAVKLYLAHAQDLTHTWTVNRGVLVESRLGPGGARYSTVGSYPMAARHAG